MTLSEAWDRMFWSIMLVIFVGLVWMKFLERVLPCEGPGLVVSICVGIAFFYRGWHNTVRRKQQADQLDTLEEEDL
jgi:hypothetical protein